FIGTNGFDNLRAKIGWAYQHIKRFDLLYVEFCRQKAYTLTEQDDPVNGRHVRRCKFTPIPADIMLSLSDFAYSLRSGLDQIAWQLRSEEHTSELQSLTNLVCRLLLE